jgi:hypothetical protein
MFIEVNVNTIDRTLVNLENVHKVMPARSGVGSILYFSDGRTQNVFESYEMLKTTLTKPQVPISQEEIKPAKKEAEKVKS